jgi:hypothetical protein
MMFRIQPEQAPEVEAPESLGCRCRDRVGAVEVLDDLLQHDGQAEGHQDLVGMGALVEVLDQPAFHDHADRP